jgi:TRAP transporter 4TM/12TM fusion protein
VAALVQKTLFIVMILMGVLYISGLHLYLRISVLPLQYYSLIVGFSLAGCYLSIPATAGEAKRLPWYDILLALISLAIGILTAVKGPSWVHHQGVLEPIRWIPAWTLVVLIVEATRRILGPILVVLVLSFLVYVKFGYLVPGIMSVKWYPWELVGGYLLTDSQAIHGIAVDVVSTMVLTFILFGCLLMATGGGRVLTNFCLSMFGRFTGGPAKVAVVSSGLFGTVSGSVSANILVDGYITIPMMIAVGYKPHIAAAIEATASTGGQIMPPVMGAAAFLICEFLGVPYVKVCIAALFPALLYYLALFIEVHLEAKKGGLRGAPASTLPPFWPSLRAMWIIALPLAILVYFLFILDYAPGKAALFTAIAVLLVAYSRKQTRLSLTTLTNTIVETGRIMIDIIVMSAVAGIIIGVIQLSGAAFALMMVFTSAGHGSAPFMLLIAAVVAMVMGMGMTTTAIYVIMAVLVAPAVISLGINPLGAHLFCFYYALMGFLTPPVAPAAWVAAPIAGAPMMKVGWACARLGIVGYIVPFIFVFSPALLLQGHFSLLVPTIITAVLGIAGLSVALEGYLIKPMGILNRILFALAGLALLMPVEFGLISIISNVAGGGLFVVVCLVEWLLWRQTKRKRLPESPAGATV